MSDEMRKAMEEITRTIAENPGAFTDEELEQLAKAAEQAQAIVPNAKMTIEEIKRALKSPGRKQKAETGQKGGGGGEVPSTVPEPPAAKPPPTPPPKLSDDVRKRLEGDAAASEIVEELSVCEGGGANVDDAFVRGAARGHEGRKAAAYRAGSAREIMAVVKSSKGMKPEEVHPSRCARGSPSGARRRRVLPPARSLPAAGLRPRTPPPAAGAGVPGGRSALGSAFLGASDAAHRAAAETKAGAKAREVLKEPDELRSHRGRRSWSLPASPRTWKSSVESPAGAVGRARERDAVHRRRHRRGDGSGRWEPWADVGG